MENPGNALSRRAFIKKSLVSATLLASTSAKGTARQTKSSPMRLGGPVFEKYDSPETWVQAAKRLGYRAAYCPVKATESDDVIKAYEKEARMQDIVIAEVGAWSNPISPNENTRRQAIEKCRTQLALADRIGANCCVNISGSRNPKHWAGHHPDNFTGETFDMIVQTTRDIIDYVKPNRTYFTLETLPWAYPDSADSYLRLVKAIDRKHFAVHLDPANLICSPQRYYDNAKLMQECFRKLGQFIKSCHAKDVILQPEFLTHIDEIRPGLGRLDYKTFLRQISKLPDVPLMLEHLPNAEEYRLAAAHIRSVANSIGLSFT